MQNKMIPTPPEVALDRVLAGLERELADATDEEIAQAGEDLGMNVKMKGTAAFLGVLGPMPKRLSDIFDVADLAQMRKAYQELIGERRVSLPPGKKNRGDDDDGG
jgi:hypothetical protein